MEEYLMKESTAKIVVHLPVEVATFLVNEKRQHLHFSGRWHDNRYFLPAYFSGYITMFECMYGT
jgi:hypothetical protein